MVLLVEKRCLKNLWSFCLESEYLVKAMQCRERSTLVSLPERLSQRSSKDLQTVRQESQHLKTSCLQKTKLFETFCS